MQDVELALSSPEGQAGAVTLLSNDDVRRLLDAAQEEATVVGKASAVCLVDDGGHVLGDLRDVAATIAAAHSAETKARTAVYFHADTGAVPPTSPVIPALTSGLPDPVNVFPGGVVLRVDGRVAGAVGVGGSTDPAEDVRVARAAAAAVSTG